MDQKDLERQEYAARREHVLREYKPHCSRWATFEPGAQQKRVFLGWRENKMVLLSLFIVFMVGMFGAAAAPKNGGQELEVLPEELHRGSLVLADASTPARPLEADELEEIPHSGGLVMQAEAAAQLAQMMDGLGRATGAGADVTRAYLTPGEAGEDHHTGLAADLLLPAGSVKAAPWVEQNCSKYGFVKVETGPNCGEGMHLRYVGVPHAALMEQQGLDLAAYLDWVADYPWDGGHLLCESADTSYQIYYVEAERGMDGLPLPPEGEYAVSGDNRGGFVVTVSTPRQEVRFIEE